MRDRSRKRKQIAPQMKIAIITFACLLSVSVADTTFIIETTNTKQEYRGMGCGTIFYSKHMTSFSKSGKDKLQNRFYDDIFKEVRTDYLQVMIPPDLEPVNDNEDPYKIAFPATNFVANASKLAICKAAKERRPEMKIYATLYTPPAWMKTNGAVSGGGEAYGTYKKGFGLEVCEYVWAYLIHMHDEGVPVDYLSLCNESDWGHSQPSYYLTPENHAKIHKTYFDYADKIKLRHPDVKPPKVVGPNMLSARGAAMKYWPAMKRLKVDTKMSVLASHDYHRSSKRWTQLRKVAGEERDVWCSEWSYHREDKSPDLIVSATEFWARMIECFNDGVNAWHAYDWAYPPRQAGEAFTHIQWGKSYHKPRSYWAFKQWCNALEPGMDVVQSYALGVHKVHVCGFLSPDKKTLVVHMVNLEDEEVKTKLKVKDFGPYRYTTQRTSRTETMKETPEEPGNDSLERVMRPRQMVTYFMKKNQ